MNGVYGLGIWVLLNTAPQYHSSYLKRAQDIPVDNIQSYLKAKFVVTVGVVSIGDRSGFDLTLVQDYAKECAVSVCV